MKHPCNKAWWEEALLPFKKAECKSYSVKRVRKAWSATAAIKTIFNFYSIGTEKIGSSKVAINSHLLGCQIIISKHRLWHVLFMCVTTWIEKVIKQRRLGSEKVVKFQVASDIKESDEHEPCEQSMLHSSGMLSVEVQCFECLKQSESIWIKVLSPITKFIHSLSSSSSLPRRL